MTVQLDDNRPVRRDAMLCVVSNVGKLRGNVTLSPCARHDDGILDRYIAPPRRFWHWIKLALRLIANRPKRDDQVGQHSGRRVGISIDGKDNYWLHGDVGGEFTNLTAEIKPGALTVCAPTPVCGMPHQLKALTLPTLAQLSPAARARRERRALRRDPYGLHPTVIEVDGRPIRSLSAGDIHDHPEVILLAGLGAPGYLAPWARESSQWTRANIVDLPGWRAGHAQACPPTLVAMAMTLAHWLEATERHDVILLGHSTGAQTVLKTAQLVPELIRGLVLAGPTLDPDARTMPALLRRAIRTLPREVPAELPAVMPSYIASGGRPLLRLIRSAMADRPEDQVQQLTMPSVVITGRHDGFAPPAWARHLAELASAPYVILPGAHNGCFPHAQAADTALRSFADLLP